MERAVSYWKQRQANTRTRKDKEMNKITSAMSRGLKQPENGKDKTMNEQDTGTLQRPRGKSPSPGFDDVQRAGRDYYEQYGKDYYTSCLIAEAKQIFTELTICLDKYLGCQTNEYEDDSKRLLAESCLVVGALCDALGFHLEEIVVKLLEK